MKCPRLRPRWVVPLGLLLLPPLFWALTLILVPMDWAKGRIVARLGQATGRPVRLQGVRIGVFGGVRLTDLRIGAPGSADDPWLRIASASMDVSLLQLMVGRVEPTRVDVEGVTLRILRRRDGHLELADLMQAVPTPDGGEDEDSPTGGESHRTRPSGLEVTVRGGCVTAIDDVSGSRLDLRGIEGKGTWAGAVVKVDELRGTVNGGPFRLAARLDRAEPVPQIEGQVEARDAALGEGMKALGYLVPVLSQSPGSLGGTLALDLSIQCWGASADALLDSLTGHGAIRLEAISLETSRLLAELANVVDVPKGGKIGSVKSDFEIRGRRVLTDDLTLTVAGTPIVMAGWTDFDRRLDYRIQVDRLAQKLPSRAREILADLEIDLKNLSVLNVRGTLDDLDVTVDKSPFSRRPGMAPGPNRRLDDRRRLQEISRRLRDRILH